MHWTVWAIPLLFGGGWEFYRAWRKATNAPVVHIANDDPAMVEAMATARATVPEFLAGGYSLRLIRNRMDEKARNDLDSRIDFKIPE